MTLVSNRHGFRSFSHNAHWVTSSGFQISLASSILSVAGLILALRDGRGRRSFNNLLSWSPSSESKSSPEELWAVPGLQNLGNNCFLNVVLQALASCSCFLNSLQKMVDEFEASSEDELKGVMPLAVSLNYLLKELCKVQREGKVLSPRDVMLAMALYTPNFNLTSQQDAEEALAHILSSLRKECSVCFASNHKSLAVATALGSRILTPERRVFYSELERWTQSFLGPFNGIVGSILTCQSCSFQISMDFQFFNCLYLSPPTYGGSSIIPGCSIDDCLKQFFVAERLENYFCTHCWHATAIKYSLLKQNESDIGKLRSCSKQDTCDCKNIPSLGSLPWSNNYSRTFKQLHIARSPKILCLNLQRASINVYGEFVKLKGHISFPLTLNISPFQNRGVGIQHSDQKLPISRLVQQNQQANRYSDFFRLQTDAYPRHIYKQGTENSLTETYIAEETRQPSSEGYADGEIQEEQNKSCSDNSANTTTHQDSKVGETLNVTPSGHHSYNLVSVVEHFGNTRSGHYTVYRRVIKNRGTSESYYWVGVSDSRVCMVSEEDVLAADGVTLLFYQRVLET
ncbi:ubiquitin carboxyl-terminal hydrolase 27 isoform X2 [Cynara cardunculus var. scolymus]|uniref:ubiquitin carboxyl-terminal hydrolase 27 isoform X2 n=1 Tax=Cynara cardunculus var. scolymus TaxID=59895 RepID=UPI000D625A47|nr:ubiquitin carboxyl-terminal hydrolase 27 isoform X2 [Cynara cardunculus var. scolymus]